MRIAIIGGGAAGLVTARVLRAVGHAVTVYEKAPDLGGVWSRTRSYPGISTQDDRVSYALSELPMPADYPVHPSGAQVRAYFESYARHFGLTDVIRLRTEVTAIDRVGDGWTVSSSGPDGARSNDVDTVVMANGNFSVSHVPVWPGRDAFEAAGGRVVVPSDLGTGAAIRDRAVLVVGWGKTSCDVAAASADIAASTVIAARVLRWKHPKRIGPVITFRHLLLTRLGEHLLSAPHRSLAGRALAKLDAPVRSLVDSRLAARVARQLDLDALGLRPEGPYADSNALVSDGFFEAVADGRLDVRGDVRVTALGADGRRPYAELSDGSRLPIDVVVPATGYDQVLSPIDAATQDRLLDDDGVLRLHRGIVPAHVTGLAFVGWMHTFHSPLTAEIQALWLANHLAEGQRVAQRDELAFALTHERAAAAGVQQLPAMTFGLLDRMLADAGVPVPLGLRGKQILRAIDPADYADVLPQLLDRLGLHPTASAPVEEQVVLAR